MKVLNYLENNTNKMLIDLEKAVRFESPSKDKELANECSFFLENLINSYLGTSVSRIQNQHHADHLKFSVGSGKEEVLILAHYDTVWEKGSLPYQVKGNLAYGPGVLDMKGGIIQAIWALKAIKDLNIKLTKKINFLLTSDEELLSPTSKELIEAEAKSNKAVLVVEPPVAKTGALKTERKGAAKFKITVEGISAHSGNHPEKGASAVHELAHQVRYIEKLEDIEKGTTTNVGMFQGGTFSNVIAKKAEAEIDARFVTAEEGERIEKEIYKIAPKNPKTKITIEGGINRPPMEKSYESQKLLEIAQSYARKNLDIDLQGESVGGVSDGNFTSAIGIPTLDGLGAVGEGPHAVNEHIIIDEMPRRSALLADLILKI